MTPTTPDPTTTTTLTTADLPPEGADRGERPRCTHEAALKEAMRTIAELRRQLATASERERWLAEEARGVARESDRADATASPSLRGAIYGLRAALAAYAMPEPGRGEGVAVPIPCAGVAPRPLTRIVIDEISPGLWKPSAWEGDRRLVSWQASTRDEAAENALGGMENRDNSQGIKL